MTLAAAIVKDCNKFCSWGKFPYKFRVISSYNNNAIHVLSLESMNHVH